MIPFYFAEGGTTLFSVGTVFKPSALIVVLSDAGSTLGSVAGVSTFLGRRGRAATNDS
jgi:hypothetical protein